MKGRLKPGKVKLERALSKLGLASRTQARALILGGQVKVGARVVRDPDAPVTPETARISIGEQPAVQAAPLTLLLNKPRGVVTTFSDEKGRPTVFSALGELGRHLIPVGRLDMATTGVLLLTNDTRLAAWLTDPVNAVPRKYLVTVRGEVTEATLARFCDGKVIDLGEVLHCSTAQLLKRSGRESHLLLELVEGKNREIRRLCLALGHEVTRLRRVAYGPLGLEGLEPGQWRELSLEELRNAFPLAPIRIK